MAHPSPLRRRLRRVAVAAATSLALTPLAGALEVTSSSVARADAAASPANVMLHVQSARSVGDGAGFVHKGDAIGTYQWMIAAEHTADHPELGVGDANDSPNHCLPNRASIPGAQVVNTDPHWADTCQWPSIRYTPGNVAVVAQGNQDDLNDGKALQNLPAGRYLISVTANGYKIDGAHFTVNGNDGDEHVTVEMQPYPLPLSTIRLRVFNDSAPVDGTYEVGAELGMSGFKATLTDVLGLVSTDYYGNPLCSVYWHWGERGAPAANPTKYTPGTRGQVVFTVDGKPVVNDNAVNNGKCVSDRNGDIVIPNLGPDRYAASVTPPSGWFQTTTLEGAHDWDIWQQEGETGFDTEQTLGGEQVPYVDFGFVHTKSFPTSSKATGHVKGTAEKILTYIGGQGGLVTPETGTAGAKDGGPISDGLVALSDLEHNDQVVYMGRTATNGTFDIPRVPDGDYQITVWDEDQDYILWTWNVTVAKGKTVNIGKKYLAGWFTDIKGTVYKDLNGNGKQDPGEAGVPQFTLTLRERDNTLMDQYTNTVTTDSQGRYEIREGYPLGKNLVLEAFNTRFQNTGVTIQADNEPSPRTMLGSAVDMNVLPIIGIGGRVDWGVQPYDKGTNGGIVGTVSYDTTRNELDPADAASETYQPGIPGIPVHLYAPVKCDASTPRPSEICSENGYQIHHNDADPSDPANGSLVKGPELQESYTSETWQPSKNCVARMYNGAPFKDADQLSLPDGNATGNGENCLEEPLSGFYAQPSDTTEGSFGQTVNGNYGFTSANRNVRTDVTAADYPKDGQGQPLALYAPLHCPAQPTDAHPRMSECATGSDYDVEDQPLPAADYIVSVDIPKDSYGKPLYQATSEEDVNVFNGDGYLPQENFPPSLAQAADQPNPPDATPTPPQPPSQQAGIISSCVGDGHVVKTDAVTNVGFAAAGGSPFEGQWRQSCTDKLVTVRDSQAVAPNFNLFTQVPLPTHFWGLIINDLGISSDLRQSGYGEAQPLPGVPTGLYDWSGRLVDTVTSDFNGEYEALEPSTSTYNCPLPAGPCPNMYRLVGNDPGQPGHLNTNYNPRFRTIATNFQAWPGLYTVTDTAPTQVAVTALTPGATQATAVHCDLDGQTPQLFAVDKPYIRRTSTAGSTDVTISGLGFGSAQGKGTVTLGSTALAVKSWSDRSITVSVPNSFASGAQRLAIKADNGERSVNGITLQLLGSSYNPTVLEVGPGKTYSTVQSALQKAATLSQALVVVWPATPTTNNPVGAYYENVVMHSSVKLQGVGPGGTYSDGSHVGGSVLDGTAFNPDNGNGAAWVALVGATAHIGPAVVPDAAVVTFLGNSATTNPNRSFLPAIDGFTITGGAQSDFPTNLNEVLGGVKTPYGASGAAVTQGGGVYVHAGGAGLHITDNVMVGNSGSYGGAVRVGTPYVTDNLANGGIAVSYNRIRDNGGTNLAGAIGLFEGSDGYSVDHNDLCGNFSAEYGGAISHFGRSQGGKILNNRIWFNQSYDEGGSVFVGGELVTSPTALSPGSGDVTIDGNRVQDNLANDDGGGLRMLMTETGRITVTNNTIVNNVSAHEGGGIALDDAPYVTFVNNTVMKNLTTATAMTSDGTPAPAGLSTVGNSDALQAYLKSRDTARYTKGFSDPDLRNNVFSDNRAGRWMGSYVSGIGSPQDPKGSDPATYDYWDMGSWDDPTGYALSPKNTLYQQSRPVHADASNKVGPFGPLVKDSFDTSVSLETSRTTPAYRQSVIVAENVPPRLMGDYHLTGSASAAYGAGKRDLAVRTDIDGDIRSTRNDAGSDQVLP